MEQGKIWTIFRMSLDVNNRWYNIPQYIGSYSSEEFAKKGILIQIEEEFIELKDDLDKETLTKFIKSNKKYNSLNYKTIAWSDVKKVKSQELKKMKSYQTIIGIDEDISYSFGCEYLDRLVRDEDSI